MNNKIDTLLKLLEIYEIRIPIIQRDYAHGRKDGKSNEIRRNLIKDIKICLEGDSAIDFNFVYGTVADGIFYPVDGQQRLTTLYLLHWFLACNCGRFHEFSKLKGFSYMTRNSAAEFFALMKQSNTKLKDFVKESVNFREEVEKQPWFQAEWGYDPTVDSVLTFLDDLSVDQDFRKNAARYYDRLECGAITFHHIVEEGSSAEEKAAKSYIRMNARGKSLEPFENLKAMIDSIEEQLDESLDIVKEYDSVYMDLLYDDCGSVSLKRKTEEINQKSLDCFKNLYNLNLQLHENRATMEADADFVNKMYEYSQKELDDDEKEFFQQYFHMVRAVFCYFQKECGYEPIKRVFAPGGYFYAENNKSAVAAVLYIAKKGFSITKEHVQKYDYVLRNLGHGNWTGNYLECIRHFAETSADYEDVFEYFNNLDFKDIEKIRDKYSGILTDLCVRFKEQKIKADIVKTENLSWKYFDQLEEQSRRRKIQYLLYLSGYWEGSGSFQKLQEYAETAKKYFIVSDDDLIWRECYAVASGFGDRNCLMPAENINRKCGKSHVWNEEYYFWDDEGDGKLSTAEPLEIIKTAYENQLEIENIIKTLPENPDYDRCWLKYAVKYHKKELLDKELTWDEEADIVTVTGYSGYTFQKKYRYDVYVMNAANPKLKYGLDETLTVFASSQCDFEANTRYTYNDGTYAFTAGDRKLVIRLRVPVAITNINENYNKDKCLHVSQKNQGKYTVYQATTPYKFKEVCYSIENELDLRDKIWNYEQQELDDMKGQDFLKIYEGKNQIWIREGRKFVWKKTVREVHFEGGMVAKEFIL
jgi:hypothetical protein